MKWIVGVLIVGVTVAGCAQTKHEPPVAKRGGATVGYKVGVPYQIKGVWYYPEENFSYSEEGLASWYGHPFHGRTTANGETYDMNEMTAAHKTLPMPSIVRVTNLENGRSVKLRVNDRGPFIDGRIIDVSRRASQMLGFKSKGTARVKVDVISEESRVLAGLPSTPTPARTTAPTTAKGISEGGRSVGYTGSDGSRDEEQAKATPVAYTDAVLPPPHQRPASSRTIVSKAPAVVPATHRGAGQRTSQPTSLAAAAAGLPGIHLARASTTGVATGTTTTGAADAAAAPRPWVQAGAFSHAPNAELVRARLRDLGPVRISAVERDGRELYRVRIGPMANKAEAGRLLVAVMEAGFPASRIVYD